MRHRRAWRLTLLAAASAALLAAAVTASEVGGAAANEFPAFGAATATADLASTAVPTATAMPSPTELPTGTAGPTEPPTGSASPSEPGCGDECGDCGVVDASPPATLPVAYRPAKAPIKKKFTIEFRAVVSYTTKPHIKVTVLNDAVKATPVPSSGIPRVWVEPESNLPLGYKVSIELCNDTQECYKPTFTPVFPVFAGYLAELIPAVDRIKRPNPQRFIATIRSDKIEHSTLEDFTFSVTCDQP